MSLNNNLCTYSLAMEVDEYVVRNSL